MSVGLGVRVKLGWGEVGLWVVGRLQWASVASFGGLIELIFHGFLATGLGGLGYWGLSKGVVRLILRGSYLVANSRGFRRRLGNEKYLLFQ